MIKGELIRKKVKKIVILHWLRWLLFWWS